MNAPRFFVALGVAAALTALIGGACVSARLVPGGAGGGGAGGEAGAGGSGGGCVVDPSFIEQDFYAVVGSPGTNLDFAVFLRAVWDEQRRGHALHPLCFQDHWTDLGESGFVRIKVDPSGRFESEFEPVAYFEGLGGAGGGAVTGDLLVPAKATPPIVPRPVLVDLTIVGDLCTTSDALCGEVSGSVLAPADFQFISLETSEILFLPDVRSPTGLVFGCDRVEIVDPTEPCPVCVVNECNSGTPFDETCQECLDAACAAEPQCNCSSGGWNGSCVAAAEAACDCVAFTVP